MADSPDIRHATRQDIPEILEVLRAALGETPLLKRTPDLFAWKHLDNPFGESIQLVADIQGRIAGFRALMRWDLITPTGETIRCVRAVDTATHPEFQRRGVFRSLTLSAIESAREAGLDMIFNTPNEKSAPGYFSMGWAHVGFVDALVRPRFGRAVTPSTELASTIPDAEPFMAGEVSDRPARGFRTPRTRSYLEWRFTGHPTARYGWIPDTKGPGGAVIRASVRRGRSETTVADLVGGAGAAALRTTARASRGRYIGTWFSKGSPERREAVRAGFLPIPGVKALRLVANPLGELPLDPSDLGSWDIAVSDLELL